MRLDEFLLDFTDALQDIGLPKMEGEILKEVAIRLLHPEVRQMIESDQVTVEAMVKEIESGMQAMGQGRGTEAPMIGAQPTNIPLGPQGEGEIQNPLITGPMPAQLPAETPMNLRFDTLTNDPRIGFRSPRNTLETI